MQKMRAAAPVPCPAICSFAPADAQGKPGRGAGTRLVVEEAPGGVLLKPAAAFPATRPEDVFGCLPADRPRSVAEMDAGVLAEAKRRHEGG